MLEVLSRTILSFLFMTVVALSAGCGREKGVAEKGVAIDEIPSFTIAGLVRDKATLEPLSKVAIGLMYCASDVPDSVLIDTSFYIPIEVWQDTGEDGSFRWAVGWWSVCRTSSRASYRECALELIGIAGIATAWKSGYKLWRYNAQRDTIFEVHAHKDSLNIYLEKLDND